MPPSELSPLEWRGDCLRLLDQTRLPHAEVWRDVRAADEAAAAIREMRVRGAPAIGVTTAYGMALAARGAAALPAPVFAAAMQRAAETLGAARPTAVNLRWAIERATAELAHGRAPREAAEALLDLAHRLREEDVATNRAIGANGAALLAGVSSLLTHCNTGSLATAGFGTALGVVRAAWRAGERFEVFFTETRPWLQGARLTAWELARDEIPARLIVDSAAALLMQRGAVDAIVVGADRIAANGDVVNKIGSYALAIAAERHGVPFYVAAPVSTIDPRSPNGASVVIEERPEEEVTRLACAPIAPEGTAAWNPAFDITPADLVTAIVTEQGIVHAPYAESLPHAAEPAYAR
ncbi:MAG: S-methyl-5-thioribose-1-phosphate isomerase [Dehalococcoidia bacterium]|nr:S-methyl-5-thioribose-1-phosphate isomerase [Dehalococcoidia bacterium]